MSNEVLIADLLMQAGVIDAAGLSRAREVQQKHAISLVKALATLGLADEKAVATAIGEKLHLELLNGDKPEILPDVAGSLMFGTCPY